MDSIVSSISDKQNYRASEVNTAEGVCVTSSATTTNGVTATTAVPVVVGELSSDLELTMTDTTSQRSSLLQQHRTVSDMMDSIDDTNDGVQALVTANIVTAEEEIPVTNQVIEDDIDEDEDEDEYEYEDDDYAAFSGFILNNDNAITGSFLSHSDIVENSSDFIETTGIVKPATIEEDVVISTTDLQELSTQLVGNSKPKWRQPSEEAVNMSLRAEKEKSGNKRRLALDLYRIMNQDTDKAGFTLVPSSEDCMDTWTIKLFQFDEDSKLAQDMKVLSVPCIELEMKFPDQYPFEPPFVRVAQPRFRRQTGFVMNGALCMELLTNDGWNPINDIESVIVSIRSLLVVGDGRLDAACALSEDKYNALLEAANQKVQAASSDCNESPSKKRKSSSFEEPSKTGNDNSIPKTNTVLAGSYSASEAQAAYSHLSEYHKKKGWDTSGWWARKG